MTKQEIIAKFQKEHDLSNLLQMQTIAECCLDAIFRMGYVTPLQEIERLSQQLIQFQLLNPHYEGRT